MLSKLSFYFSDSPDVILTRITENNVTEGDVTVMLLCSAKGEPETYNFSKWLHYGPDGVSLIQEYKSTMIDHNKAYLSLKNTSYMDSGIYECRVTNGIVHYRTGKLLAVNRLGQLFKGDVLFFIDVRWFIFGTIRIWHQTKWGRLIHLFQVVGDWRSSPS